MSKLIICRGLPGSGKSFKAKQYVQAQADLGNFNVINLDRDAFRTLNGFGLQPGPFENNVNLMRDAVIKSALKKNYTVIESSTNLRLSSLRDLLAIAENYGAEVEFWDIKTDLETCILWDKMRGEGGGHQVGESVIRNIYDRFLKQGWPKVPKTKPGIKFESYVPDVTKPKAIIVDIDGTVAQVNGRSPYSYTDVSTDLPRPGVIDRVQEAERLGYEIIFMSGREAICKLDTINWLRNHVKLKYFELHMRDTDDNRQDFIVKYELFDELVRNNYNVLYCLDDREQVIKMYRSLGLVVLDVAGNQF